MCVFISWPVTQFRAYLKIRRESWTGRPSHRKSWARCSSHRETRTRRSSHRSCALSALVAWASRPRFFASTTAHVSLNSSWRGGGMRKFRLAHGRRPNEAVALAAGWVVFCPPHWAAQSASGSPLCFGRRAGDGVLHKNLADLPQESWTGRPSHRKSWARCPSHRRFSGRFQAQSFLVSRANLI